MKLYRVPDAPPGERWQRTQDDARKLGKFEGVEVPTDQRGLLAFLNERERDWTGGAPPAAPEAPPPAAPEVPQDGRCSRCRGDLKTAERAYKRLAEGLEIDALCERIDAASGWHLERLVSAVTARLNWLTRHIKDEGA